MCKPRLLCLDASISHRTPGHQRPCLSFCQKPVQELCQERVRGSSGRTCQRGGVGEGDGLIQNDFVAAVVSCLENGEAQFSHILRMVAWEYTAERLVKALHLSPAYRSIKSASNSLNQRFHHQPTTSQEPRLVCPSASTGNFPSSSALERCSIGALKFHSHMHARFDVGLLQPKVAIGFKCVVSAQHHCRPILFLRFTTVYECPVVQLHPELLESREFCKEQLQEQLPDKDRLFSMLGVQFRVSSYCRFLGTFGLDNCQVGNASSKRLAP